MASDPVRGRIGEALAASVDEDWTDVLIVARSRSGNIRLLYQATDIVTALGLLQAADLAVKEPLRIIQTADAPTSNITLKGAN